MSWIRRNAAEIVLIFILVVLAALILHSLATTALAEYCRVVRASYYWQGHKISYLLWCCGDGCGPACWRGYGYGPCW